MDSVSLILGKKRRAGICCRRSNRQGPAQKRGGGPIGGLLEFPYNIQMLLQHSISFGGICQGRREIGSIEKAWLELCPRT